MGEEEEEVEEDGDGEEGATYLWSLEMFVQHMRLTDLWWRRVTYDLSMIK